MKRRLGKKILFAGKGAGRNFSSLKLSACRIYKNLVRLVPWSPQGAPDAVRRWGGEHSEPGKVPDELALAPVTGSPLERLII